ncbi:DUF922 domain-containing protein [Arenimonas sp.]|uniref:DUF922 domain-containing protein n=1 Tax=Arenimonas sp. TaxID=1872635 RepID=UPI0025C4EB0F|nr:DUF922 domain-containing protein [Arenimonas sp.]
MRNSLTCLVAALAMSMGIAAAQSPGAAGAEPGFWFRQGVRPPPLAPMRALPEVMRTLTPITDTADRSVIGRNVQAVFDSVPMEGVCLSLGLTLLTFEGDEDFYHPFMLWLPYALISKDVYSRWSHFTPEGNPVDDPYVEGPKRYWRPTLDTRSLYYDTPEQLARANASGGSVEIVEARFARRETIVAYADSKPWPRYPQTVTLEGCNGTPLATQGPHSNLGDAYLFVRAIMYVPYMVDSQKLSPEKRELWRQHQNDTMMHELVHLEGLLRILSDVAARLRAQAEHDRIEQADYLARFAASNVPQAPLIIEVANRPKPLNHDDQQLTAYLRFIKQRFDDHALSYHAFLGYQGRDASQRRYDNSGDLPPYMDTAQGQARLLREFEESRKVREALFQSPRASEGE